MNRKDSDIMELMLRLSEIRLANLIKEIKELKLEIEALKS